MKHKLLILLSVILIVTAACKTAQKSVQKSETSSSELAYEKLDKALLWKITGNGLAEPSYLYGTIHIIPKEKYFLPNGTLSAIDASKQVFFEIDMKDMNDMSKQMGLLTKAFMKDDMTLKDLYTDEEYAIVKAHFDEMGLPLFFLEKVKPMFLSVFASGDIDPNAMQDGSIKSYEMEFYEIASNSNKETGGLETIEYQMSVFDSIPYEEQADMLLSTIQDKNAVGSLDSMVNVYIEQDIEGMQTMFEDEDSGVEGHEDVLLYNRNRNWIPVMSAEMKEGTTFFAVGAGHLAGPIGVIHLLKQEGYTVEPVK